MTDYSIDELISVCIARQVVDGEVLAQGINTPLVLAGFILAKCTHAPGVSFACAIGQSLCQEWAPLSVSRVEELWLDRSLLNVGFATAAADLLPGYHPKEFFRPAQIDAAGNSNNLAFGADYHRPRLRLPGSGGIPDVSPGNRQAPLLCAAPLTRDFRRALRLHQRRRPCALAQPGQWAPVTSSATSASSTGMRAACA